MTAVAIQTPSPRKKVFDITVVPGTPQVIIPDSLEFNIVAVAPGGAGTYSIEYALTEELGDYRPLNNGETNANTGLSNGGTLTARTTTIYSPGVQKLRFTATTASTRFIAYGD